MESIASIFHIDWKILIAQTLNFCLVTFVLWRFVWKPIGTSLNERNEKIDRGLQMAEASKREMEQAKSEAEKMILEARSESQKIIGVAVSEAKNLQKEELERSKVEAEKIIESGKRALLSEKENILKSIRAEAAELVMYASSSILRDVSTATIDRELAEKALAEIVDEEK